VKIKFTKGNTTAYYEFGLLLVLCLIFFCDRTDNKAVFTMIAPHIIDAMKWVLVAFLGLNVTDNLVQGKFYNSNLAARDVEK